VAAECYRARQRHPAQAVYLVEIERDAVIGNQRYLASCYRDVFHPDEVPPSRDATGSAAPS
jgi:hypothetical protein